MSYRTILVCLNETDRAAELLRLAAGLALKHEAHLIGMFVIPGLRIYPATGLGMTPDVFEAHQEVFKARADTARSLFDGEMGKGAMSAEWRVVESASPLVADTVVEHALHSDLVIASQSSHESSGDIEADFAERIVMESGRPVLLVPYYGQFEHCGTRVLVGWNATREAARATFDAVPILKHSDAVHITWVDPEGERELSGPAPGTELATALSRHGIKATAEGLPRSGISAGEALLSHASDLGADLIVMGGYGHGRLREFILGGATRTILQAMTVPVLMSH